MPDGWNTNKFNSPGRYKIRKCCREKYLIAFSLFCIYISCFHGSTSENVAVFLFIHQRDVFMRIYIYKVTSKNKSIFSPERLTPVVCLCKRLSVIGYRGWLICLETKRLLTVSLNWWLPQFYFKMYKYHIFKLQHSLCGWGFGSCNCAAPWAPIEAVIAKDRTARCSPPSDCS